MTIEYTKQSEAYLDRQAKKQAERIKQAIGNLPAGDVKKLRGIVSAYRLRVGGVRILFIKDNDTIRVVKIDNRGDVYK